MNYQMLAIAVTAGASVELFFQIIKVKIPVAYRPVSGFMSVSRKRWLKYILFRFIPLFAVSIFVLAIYKVHFSSYDASIYLLFMILCSLLFRDIPSVFRAKYASFKIVHIATIFFALAIIPVVTYFVEESLKLSSLLPDPKVIAESVLSSFLTAAMISAYYKTADFAGEQKIIDGNTVSQQEAHYIALSYGKIKERYGRVIRDACESEDCSSKLLYAVLIYENINRPEYVRAFERIVASLTKRRMTIGIAQVSTTKPISDEDSIKRAAKILKGSQKIEDDLNGLYGIQKSQCCYKREQKTLKKIGDVLSVYNDGEQYVREVYKIINILWGKSSRSLYPAYEGCIV